MNLGPAKSCNFVVVNTEEETFEIKPGFLHSVFKICHRPISLVGVAREDEVLEINEDVDGQTEDFLSIGL